VREEGGSSAAEDSYFRQRIAQLFIEAETMRLNAYRGLTGRTAAVRRVRQAARACARSCGASQE